MLQAGNVERILVFGILVVIGLILVVAIKGARDVEEEFDQSRKLAMNTGVAVVPETTEGADRGGGAEGAGAGRVTDERLRNGLRQSTQGWRGEVSGQPGDEQERAGSRGPRARPGAPGGDDPTTGPSRTGTEEQGGSELGNAGNLRSGSREASETDLQAALSKLRNRMSSAPAGEADRAGLAAPPSAADPETPSSGNAEGYYYVVQKGDTLEGIARVLYGKPASWQKILDANPRLTDPRRIQPEMRLKLPEVPTRSRENVELLGQAGGPATARGAAGGSTDGAVTKSSDSKAAFQRRIEDETYTVQRGDTLMAIARHAYGTDAAWRLIYNANADLLPDQDHIREGQKLKLPRGDGLRR